MTSPPMCLVLPDRLWILLTCLKKAYRSSMNLSIRFDCSWARLQLCFPTCPRWLATWVFLTINTWMSVIVIHSHGLVLIWLDWKSSERKQQRRRKLGYSNMSRNTLPQRCIWRKKELRERSITNDIDECVCIYLNGWVVFFPCACSFGLSTPPIIRRSFFPISLSNRAARHIFILCCSTEVCLFFVVLISKTHFHRWRNDVIADWSDPFVLIRHDSKRSSSLPPMSVCFFQYT